MSSAFRAQLPFVAETRTLGWVKDDVAQSYMKHIMERVEALLPRRGWHVGVLKEFYPRGASLLGLNVNAGAEVCVRFRVPGQKDQFLPFHEVVCTTLHELAHCQISPHSAAFWKLYYELVRECEALEVDMIRRGRAIYPPHVSEPATVATSASGDGDGRRGAAASRAKRPRGGAAAKGPPRSTGTQGGGYKLGGGPPGIAASGLATRAAASGGSRTVQQRAPKLPKGCTDEDPPRAQEGSDAWFQGAGHRLGTATDQSSRDTAQPLCAEGRRRLVAQAAARRMEEQRKLMQNARGPESGPTHLLSAAPSPAEEDKHTPRDEDSDGRSSSGQQDEPPRLSLSQVAERVAATVPNWERPDRGEEEGTDSATESSTGQLIGGTWRCARCGFDNVREASTCAMCADVAEGEDDEVFVVGESPEKRARKLEGTADAPIPISDSDEAES